MDRNYRPHTPRQGSQNNRGPRALGSELRNKRSHRSEKHMHGTEEPLLPATRAKPRAAQTK